MLVVSGLGIPIYFVGIRIAYVVATHPIGEIPKMRAPKKYYDHRTGQMKPTGQGKLAPLGSSGPPAPIARGKRGWFGKIAASLFGKRGGRR